MAESIISLNGESVQTLEVLFLTTIITLLPSLLVMMTPFTRYVISFSFLRTALGTQQTPPNIVLIGMALFLTLFTMGPTLDAVQTEAYDPYIAEQSPYHSAYLAVVESVSKLIATGASFEDVYLTFQEYFEKPMKDGKRWGKACRF